MIAFPNAKINIGLDVVNKREDGYHNIYGTMFPVPWYDVLEIIASDHFEFASTGIEIPDSGGKNLVVQAYKLLAEDFDLPPVEIRLHKTIPIGAGLGGGSSDAAHMLKLINEKFDLNLTDQQLEKYAAQLGSDCAFFVRNQPSIVSERGDRLESFEIDLSDLMVVMVNPCIHISTSEAYGNVEFSSSPVDLPAVLTTRDFTRWREQIQNGFEKSIFPIYPELPKIKDQLYEMGARYASMSGSGSTIYGIFDHKVDLSHINKGGYQVFQGKLGL